MADRAVDDLSLVVDGDHDAAATTSLVSAPAQLQVTFEVQFFIEVLRDHLAVLDRYDLLGVAWVGQGLDVGSPLVRDNLLRGDIGVHFG